MAGSSTLDYLRCEGIKGASTLDSVARRQESQDNLPCLVEARGITARQYLEIAYWYSHPVRTEDMPHHSTSLSGVQFEPSFVLEKLFR